MNRKYILLSLLLALLTITSLNYTQQQERTSETQLTRDQSLFPFGTKSTGTSIWTELHPLIPRVDYWGVDFVNADTGWAVGEGGAIIKTTNGGQNWIWYESGVENTLRTVSSVNGQRVIAAGDGGIIIISEDGGKSWNTLPSGTTDNIWNMQMITDEIGWMVGESATALKTTDGGLTWNQQPIPYPGYSYWDVSFADTNVGYISCSVGVVLKTTDGGINWIMQIAGDTRALWTIYAIDTLRVSSGGFAGKVVYTTNGGNNWLYSGGNPSVVNKIKFINDTTGYMAGSFYKSIDGGVSWFPLYDLKEKGSHPGTTNLAFPDGTDGYVTGINMLLAKTTNNGENWRRTIVNASLINVYFKDEQNGFMNSSHFIYTTSDGGYTLDTLETFPYSLRELTQLMFLDSLTGFVGTGGMKIYKTINGGLDWYSTNISGLIDTLGSIKKIFFYNRTLGWAVSTRGYILGTSDGGENWIVQLDAGINVIFQSIFFIDSSVGWTANVNRRPYKTTDGGINWAQQNNLSINNSYDVYFKDSLNGWILSENKLYRTTDGGNTWFQDTQISAFTLRFKVINDSHFIITWNIYESTDAGNTWLNITSEVGTSFLDLHAPYEYFCVPIGTRGLVMNYTDTSIVSVRHSLENNPSTFDLKQNYPNPFNSATIIKYSLPEKSFVNISLYNIKGERVLELVNEEKEMGTYIIKLNGDKLSTGVYLYRMYTSSGFESSKKLIILK